MSYSERFGTTQRTQQPPNCYAKNYDGADNECQYECPFRENCYKEWRSSYYNRQTSTTTPSYQVTTPARTAAAAPTASTVPARYEPAPQRALVPEVLPPINDILPYPGEKWFERLWWNACSAGLSAVGQEMHIFFKHYRFPPSQHAYTSERRVQPPAALPAGGVDPQAALGQTPRGDGGR